MVRFKTFTESWLQTGKASSVDAKISLKRLLQAVMTSALLQNQFQTNLTLM